MSNKAIGQHLVALFIDYFPHFWCCAIGGLGMWKLVWVFHVSAIFHQMSFPVIAIVDTECFLVLLQDFFQFVLIRTCFFANFR